MNIFYLDACPIKAAQMQCDKHVVKMIIETAQMLCTAHHMLDGETHITQLLYRSTHKNHPSTVWARTSVQNYNWLYEHFIALCDEYTFRYNKTHLTDTKFRDLLKTPPQNLKVLSGKGITLMPLAMNNQPQCMFPHDPIKSYRLYYKTKLNNMSMVWTKRPQPDWWEDTESINTVEGQYA